jgi:hypothetical protein
MSKKHGAISALVCALVSGCAAAHDSGDVAQGIYALTIESELDACAPARTVGAMGDVAVIVEDGTIDAPVPDTDGAALIGPRVSLAPSSDFHAETNRRIPGCEGAFVHEEWTVLDARGGAFTIAHSQDWQGLAGCADPEAAMPGAPAADCSSERELHYALAERCVAPCSLRLSAGPTITCACD